MGREQAITKFTHTHRSIYIYTHTYAISQRHLVLFLIHFSFGIHLLKMIPIFFLGIYISKYMKHNFEQTNLEYILIVTNKYPILNLYKLLKINIV